MKFHKGYPKTDGATDLMQSEDEVSQRIQMEAPKLHCKLMRNNSGALSDETGRTVRFGLDNVSKEHNKKFKSSDYIGITSILITPEMVGKVIGVFTASEIKKQAWDPNKKLDEREQAQQNFINFIRLRGGIADFNNSVESFRKMIDSYMEYLRK